MIYEQPQLASFDGQNSKDPDDFFRQYRIQFNRSQSNIDSIHKIKFKKQDEDDQANQQEPNSLLQIQFDKIAISPIQISRNSNISESNKNIQSDSSPIKHLGPYSNNLGSDQLNELQVAVGSSHLNPNLKYNQNNELELDYSSYNQESNQISNTPIQIPNKTINIQDKESALNYAQYHYDDDERDNSLQMMDEKRQIGNDDYDELYDYNFTEREQEKVDNKGGMSIKQMLRQSLKKMFNYLKIESSNIQHEVELNQDQYRLINDLSSDVTIASNEKLNSLLFKIIQNLCFCSSISSLNPSSILCLVWDVATVIFYMGAFILITIQIFLNSGIFYQQIITDENWVRPTLYAFFILDIIKNLITGYYYKGNYESDIKYIIYRYIKVYCIFDLIALIPLIWQFDEIETFSTKVTLCLLYLGKYSSIKLCLERIRVAWYVTQNNAIHRQLIQLISIFMLYIHSLAIIYHGLSLIEINQEYDNQMTWLRRYNFLSKDASQKLDTSSNVWSRYLHSLTTSALYLSSQAGNFPVTRLEQIFGIFASFLSLMYFAYCFNLIHSTFKKLNKEQASLREEKSYINYYMENMKVASNIRGRITNYLEYLHEKRVNINSLQYTGAIAKKLPNELREDLIYSAKSFYVPYFTRVLRKFTKQSINSIYKIIEEHSYTPGEIIFSEGDKIEPSIYAIVSGKVEIFLSGSQLISPNGLSTLGNNRSYHQRTSKAAAGNPSKSYTRLALLKNKDFFGEISFFTNLPPSASARCTEFCTIVKIDRQKFIKLLNDYNYEEDFEMMCMLRDDVLFKKNFRAIDARCWCCHRFGHLAKSCKLTHFYPLKSHIIHDIQLRSSKLIEEYAQLISEYIERYYPGQSNQSDYLPSSQTASSANQQSSNTEILSDKVEYEQLHGGAGSNIDLPQPFNTNFKPSNTLNESSMLRQAGSSKVKHKDSSDSGDIMLKERKESKGRKDSAQTKNSNDSFIKHKSTNRSSNKRDSPIEIITKLEQQPDSSNKRKGSSDCSFSQPTESYQRDKTLKSQKTRGTQKTNKTNKSGSSIYRSKFDHSVPTQRMDSRVSYTSITTPPPKVATPQQSLQQENTKILVTTSATKSTLKNNPSTGVSGNNIENPESQQDLSYELVLPKIELVMMNNNIPKQPLIENSPDQNTHFSSMNLDQQSYFSKSESNLISGISSLYVDSQNRHHFQSSLLEFDCMKNFKVYNTRSNPKNVLEAPAHSHKINKRPQKKVTIIAS